MGCNRLPLPLIRVSGTTRLKYRNQVGPNENLFLIQQNVIQNIFAVPLTIKYAYILTDMLVVLTSNGHCGCISGSYLQNDAHIFYEIRDTYMHMWSAPSLFELLASRQFCYHLSWCCHLFKWCYHLNLWYCTRDHIEYIKKRLVQN